MADHLIEQQQRKMISTKKLLLSLFLGFCVGLLCCVVIISIFSVNHQQSLIVFGVSANPAKEHNSNSQISVEKFHGDLITSLTICNCSLSNRRTDVCEMNGDVRIHGKSSSVAVVDDRHSPSSRQIKPYARKFDKSAMQHIKQVLVRVTSTNDAMRCAASHTSPAVVFTVGGYVGNYYHDYTDVLIPLFITAQQFAGDVHLLVYTQRLWWIAKYEQILKQLSRHDIVFLDSDEQVRCYPRAIVGLHSHKAMSIDPARAPGGYSMLDFIRFLRATYSLQRAAPIKLGEAESKKPRLLLIPRKRSRKFINLDQIVGLAEELGFEVVKAEAATGTNVAKFARVVNSCDVMVGVHGAGLTNFVYLPTNAVVVQIVPFGNLANISRSCFKYSSEDAGLRYLDYCIGAEESSLIERYSREDAVFMDPNSIHRLGWKKMGEVYLKNQDVKLDLDRFRPVLLQARELLRRQEWPSAVVGSTKG